MHRFFVSIEKMCYLHRDNPGAKKCNFYMCLICIITHIKIYYSIVFSISYFYYKNKQNKSKQSVYVIVYQYMRGPHKLRSPQTPLQNRIEEIKISLRSITISSSSLLIILGLLFFQQTNILFIRKGGTAFQNTFKRNKNDRRNKKYEFKRIMLSRRKYFV